MKAKEGPDKSPGLSIDEETRTVARVPRHFPLTDGADVTMRKLKFKELVEHSDVLVDVLRVVAGEHGEVDATDPNQRLAFLGLIMKASWQPFLTVLALVTNLKEQNIDDLDADDGLLMLIEFAKLHAGLKKTFFVVLEALGKAKKASGATSALQASLTRSSGKGTRRSTS